MRRILVFAAICLFLLPALGAQGAPGDAVPATDEATAALQAELAASTERVAELEARIAELEASLSSLEADSGAWESSRSDYETRIADLESYASDVENERAHIEALMGAEVSGRAMDAEAAAAMQDDLFAAIETAQQERDELQARVDELETELALREAAAGGDGEAAAARAAWELDGGIDDSRFPILLAGGFRDAKPRIGSWKLGPDSAEQTDPNQFFSRLDLPLGQGEGRAYLYRFTARASGAGWVGLGIHFFASNVKAKRGYGEGRSLLVWLTRDQAVRRTDATWLQLYRSFDDVNMERVFDAKLEEAILETHAVEIVYDSATGYLVVALDGRVNAVYRTFFGIDEGVGVSLRTLGAGAVFGDFEILATEAP